MENTTDHRERIPSRIKLYLAPMEGVGARPFRKAIDLIGGFDEATTEFIRVPANSHPPSLAKRYDANELSVPIAAQIMGSDPKLCQDMTLELIRRGAPRIDLNCGCPSNTVTGRGAGSSLLKEPKHLFEVASAIKQVCSVPFSVKLRSGFLDESLFAENLMAAQEAGACQIALHPRTKVEGYKPPANWHLIAKAKELLTIPVIGNGDILNLEDAKRMLKETGCDGLMIGRGAVINPFIFKQLRAEHFDVDIEAYLKEFAKQLAPKRAISQLKQICRFLFQQNDALMDRKTDMLRGNYVSIDDFVSKVLPVLQEYFITKV